MIIFKKKLCKIAFVISGKAGAAGGAKKEEEKKEEIKFDPVTPDMIKKDKGFVKANKKYSKEYETLKKKQNKVEHKKNQKPLHFFLHSHYLGDS